MGGKTNPAYPVAFRSEAVELFRSSDKSIPVLAREVGIGEQTLRGWVRQAEIDAGRGQAEELTSAERTELQRLRREVKTLEQEREILKNRRGRWPCLLQEKLRSDTLGKPRGVAASLLVRPSP